LTKNETGLLAGPVSFVFEGCHVTGKFAVPRRLIEALSLFTFAAAALLTAAPAAAQDAAKDIAAKAQVCTACHGAQGVPIDKTIPVIWGQQPGYLYLQLRDFKSGARKSPLMGPIAKGLSRDDMMALAEYFSKKPWTRLGQPQAPANVVTEAERTNGSIGCTGCHQGNFQGAGTQPRLAGQRREYLESQMLAFRDGSRGNNPGMSDLMKAATKAQLAVMAQYLAGL
jgi:cytochrome c553